MHIDIIEGFEAFTKLKEDWDAVYDADPEAHFFLSFTWLSNWFRNIDCQIFVLAAKPTADAPAYVAFFPLLLRTERNESGQFYNEIWMGGAKFAPYTGFTCVPEYEDGATLAFAEHIRSISWAVLRLENIFVADRRIRLFLKSFSRTKFVTENIIRIGEDDEIDNDICLYVKLPDDWETFLKDNLGPRIRQKARRVLRMVEEPGEFRITHTNGDTFERDLNILLGFWQSRWGPIKGEKLGDILGNNRKMLTGCFNDGSLFLPVLWRGETPLAARAALMDTKKRTLICFIIARDLTVKNPSPGFVLNAYSIRWAIQNGFTTLDLTMGNHPYKYDFGPEERRIQCIQVSDTKNNQNRGKNLNITSLEIVLERAMELHNAGKVAEAEQGYRQILDVDPQYESALNLLGQIMAGKGDYGQAEKLFRVILAVKPDADKVWFRLGKTLQAQGDREGAILSYRKVLQLDPANRDVPPLLAELSPLKDLLRVALGTRPSWMNDGIEK